MSGDASGSKFEGEVLDEGAGGEPFGEKMNDWEELDTGGDGTDVWQDSSAEAVGVGVNTEDFVG